MNLPVHPELGSEFDYEKALDAFRAALRGEHPAPAAKEIAQVVVQLGALLFKKNAAYGDSALKPVEVFASGLTPAQRMGVRMDDKISRLARGAADGEDVVMDLAGYILLQRIAVAQAQPQVDTSKPAHKVAQEADIKTLNESIALREGRRAAYEARIADEAQGLPF